MFILVSPNTLGAPMAVGYTVSALFAFALLIWFMLTVRKMHDVPQE
jgi:hypothetical protein